MIRIEIRKKDFVSIASTSDFCPSDFGYTDCEDCYLENCLNCWTEAVENEIIEE